MNDEQCVLAHPRGVGVFDLELLTTRQMQPQRHERLALRFLLYVLAGHSAFYPLFKSMANLYPPILPFRGDLSYPAPLDK